LSRYDTLLSLGADVRRREFLGVLAGAAGLPLPLSAQQSGMPVIGYLHSGRQTSQTANITAFRAGLKEAGLIEGQTVSIEFRWADDNFDRLPALASELINRPVAAIFANGQAAFRAKAATPSMPIIFITGTDPVRDGLVGSLNRPGGNVTGAVFITGTLGTKRLELLRQIVPKASRIAAIINPNTSETEEERKDLQAAAVALGLRLTFFEVTNRREIDAAFEALTQQGADALIMGAGAFMFSNRQQVVALATRHALPAVYPQRESVIDGGLLSYGTSSTEAYRQAALYVARVLRGEKPADLPVVQSSKFEFVINLKTAKALGIEIHPQLLATADEVIE
jgi:putative ABC transport system substrate-binding protein